MKKGVKLAGVGLFVLLVVLFLTLNVWMGSAVKMAVNAGGSPVLGVPVSLEDADVRLLRGLVRLNGLVIGNPPGFQSDHMFRMSEFRIDMYPTSAFSDTIRIREIIIDAPDIVYEMSLGGSNIGTLINTLPEEKKDVPDEAAPGEGKRVEIDRLVISNAKIRITSKLLQGKGVTIPLPTVELTDIGKEDRASVASAAKEVVAAVATSIMDAVKASGSLVGEGAKASVDAAAEAGGAVLDSGKAAAGAVTEGAGKLIDGIGGLFKGDQGTPESPAE